MAMVAVGGSQIFFQWQAVLGAIEEIECLAPELELGALGKWNALGESEVGLPQIWPASDVAWSVAVASGSVTAVNAAGLIQFSVVPRIDFPPGGVNETPGTRLGR